VKVKSLSLTDTEYYKSGSMVLTNGTRTIEVQLDKAQRAQVLALMNSWKETVLVETASAIRQELA
jgi:hypothetical protein